MRVAFYYTHYQCLGHTTRIISLILELNRAGKEKVRAYLFEGSLPQEFVKFPARLKRIRLPFPLYSRDSFRSSAPGNLLAARKMQLRTLLFIDKIRSANPHVFITEHFPFGHTLSKFEIPVVLKYLHARNRRILCSLGYPLVVRSDWRELGAILEFYERILIHTPAETELDYALDYVKEKRIKRGCEDFFSRYGKKIDFTGYVLPFNIGEKESGDEIRKRFSAEKKKLILVTRGAGAYYPKIISSAIACKKNMEEDCVFLVVAGPSTSKKEWSLFNSLLKKYKTKGLYLYKFIPNLPDYFKEADLVVSSAAYNTSVTLMYYNKFNSVVIPFKGYSAQLSFEEQPIRSRMLGDILGSHGIDYDRLTPGLLARAVTNQLRKRANNCLIDRRWFQGAEKSAEIILGGNS